MSALRGLHCCRPYPALTRWAKSCTAAPQLGCGLSTSGAIAAEMDRAAAPQLGCSLSASGSIAAKMDCAAAPRLERNSIEPPCRSRDMDRAAALQLGCSLSAGGSIAAEMDCAAAPQLGLWSDLNRINHPKSFRAGLAGILIGRLQMRLT